MATKRLPLHVHVYHQQTRHLPQETGTDLFPILIEFVPCRIEIWDGDGSYHVSVLQDRKGIVIVVTEYDYIHTGFVHIG